MSMDRERPRLDRDLRELLTYLRDTFRDAAGRIDAYLERQEPSSRGREPWGNTPPQRGRERDRDRDAPRDGWRNREPVAPVAAPRDYSASPDPDHESLERLRQEVRSVSNDAPEMEHGTLRLYVEAITAETRQLQARATDPVDQETAARIMRALTAIVSEHRPGHVYGLARHHQTDWTEMAARARDELRERGAPSPRVSASNADAQASE